MEGKLSVIASLGQKDKAPALSSLLQETISTQNQPSFTTDLHTFVESVVNQDNLLIGRQILTDVVKALTHASIGNHNIRKNAVEDTLAVVLPKIVSYEEQVCLRNRFPSATPHHHKGYCTAVSIS